MLKSLLKLMALAFLLFAAYKAMQLYSIYKFATYAGACTSFEQICSLAKQKASNREVTAAIAATYACIEKKQPFFESWFVPVPPAFLNPPPESFSYADAEKSCNSR